MAHPGCAISLGARICPDRKAIPPKSLLSAPIAQVLIAVSWSNFADVAIAPSLDVAMPHLRGIALICRARRGSLFRWILLPVSVTFRRHADPASGSIGALCPCRVQAGMSATA